MINRFRPSLRVFSTSGSTFFTPSHYIRQGATALTSSGGGCNVLTSKVGGGDKARVDGTGRSRSISFSSNQGKKTDEEGEVSQSGNGEEELKNLDSDSAINSTNSSTLSSNSASTVGGSADSDHTWRARRSRRQRRFRLLRCKSAPPTSLPQFPPFPPSIALDHLWAGYRPLLESSVHPTKRRSIAAFTTELSDSHLRRLNADRLVDPIYNLEPQPEEQEDDSVLFQDDTYLQLELLSPRIRLFREPTTDGLRYGETEWEMEPSEYEMWERDTHHPLHPHLIAQRQGIDPACAPGTERYLAGQPGRFSRRQRSSEEASDLLGDFLDPEAKRRVAEMSPFNPALRPLLPFAGIPEPSPLPPLNTDISSKDASNVLESIITKNKWGEAAQLHDAKKFLDQVKDRISNMTIAENNQIDDSVSDSSYSLSKLVQKAANRHSIPSAPITITHATQERGKGTHIASFDWNSLRALETNERASLLMINPINYFDGTESRTQLLKEAVALKNSLIATWPKVEEALNAQPIMLDSVKRKRRKKMTRQKYKKRRRLQKFLRKKQGK